MTERDPMFYWRQNNLPYVFIQREGDLFPTEIRIATEPDQVLEEDEDDGS